MNFRRLIFTPMGEHQVAAVAACTCEPEWVDVAHDVDCPVHGLEPYLRERLEADARSGEAA